MVFPLFVSFYFTFPFHKKKAMPKIIHLALPFLVIAFLVIAFLEKRCFLKNLFPLLFLFRLNLFLHVYELLLAVIELILQERKFLR